MESSEVSEDAGPTGPPIHPATVSGTRATPFPVARSAMVADGAASRPAQARPVRRKHPAAGARKVALVASIAATGVVSGAMLWADRTATAVPTTTAASVAVSGKPTTAAAATGSTATAAAPSVSLRSGTWTGAVETFRWGDVQVAATVSNGKVTAVDVLAAPSGGKSASINARATPILEGEAVAAQGSKISAVSGATLTSKAYASSLQAALDRATGATTT